jgi:hypothetical protein
LRIAAGFQGPVLPNNTESATRIETAANKTEFFDHRIVDRRSGVHHRTKREKTEKRRQVGDERFSSNYRSRKNIRHRGIVVRRGGFALWGESELIWTGTQSEKLYRGGCALPD